jgi:hypothetical protein
MKRASLVVVVTVVAVALTLAACGDDADEGSSPTSTSLSPLADAFADQLALDAGDYWFRALDRADTECFASAALDSISAQRQSELRMATDHIPLLFQSDWTDGEIDALTDIFDACVSDDTTGTEAFVFSLLGPQASRYSDCLVTEVTETLGDRYWVDQFRGRFTPPRVETAISDERWQAELAGEAPPPPASFAEVEPALEECIPGYGDPVDYPDDACGDGPCEDPPDPEDFRRVVLECSRDPFVDASFYEGPEQIRIDDGSCQEQGGTLLAVRLIAYPCPEGPTDFELAAAGGPITGATITDACG